MIQKPRLSTAFDAFKEKDYDETVKQFKDQANRGDPVAQYNLGIIYETGVGIGMTKWLKGITARRQEVVMRRLNYNWRQSSVAMYYYKSNQSQSSGNQPAQSCIILVLINHIQSFIGGFFWQWNR